MATAANSAIPRSPSIDPIISPTLLRAGLVAVRLYVGLVFLSNGLAKAFDRSNVKWGGFSFSLITRASARSIASGASKHSDILVLSGFYRGTVIPHWSFFGIFLTVAELALGASLIVGFLTRISSIGGILLIAPIWVMLWHTGDYLWDYPADLAPLLLLAVLPAGRVLGVDAVLYRRFPHWPF